MEKTLLEVHLGQGHAIKYAMLSTHYRKPLEISPATVAASRKALRKLFLAMEPTREHPTQEFLDILANDLDTPGAFALLHRYRKEGRGPAVFAGLKLLGFLDGVELPEGMAVDKSKPEP
jgi:cysteinyl-tRNA synthetase